MTTEQTPTIAISGATKRFGAVLALDDVTLHANAGEVLALLGDNGAGKSTLIKCLSGVHRLDTGTIEVNGAEIHMTSPSVARAAGIETVYQDLALFDNLDTTANFFVGREEAGPRWLPRGMRWMRNKQMAAHSTELVGRLFGNRVGGSDLGPQDKVPAKALSTWSLLQDPSAQNRGELAWRLGLALDGPPQLVATESRAMVPGPTDRMEDSY